MNAVVTQHQIEIDRATAETRFFVDCDGYAFGSFMQRGDADMAASNVNTQLGAGKTPRQIYWGE